MTTATPILSLDPQAPSLVQRATLHACVPGMGSTGGSVTYLGTDLLTVTFLCRFIHSAFCSRHRGHGDKLGAALFSRNSVHWGTDPSALCVGAEGMCHLSRGGDSKPDHERKGFIMGKGLALSVALGEQQAACSGTASWRPGGLQRPGSGYVFVQAPPKDSSPFSQLGSVKRQTTQGLDHLKPGHGGLRQGQVPGQGEPAACEGRGPILPAF